MTACVRVAKSLSSSELSHIVRALNNDLDAHVASGKSSTQAHFGMIEMAQACANELVGRDYADLTVLAPSIFLQV